MKKDYWLYVIAIVMGDPDLGVDINDLRTKGGLGFIILFLRRHAGYLRRIRRPWLY